MHAHQILLSALLGSVCVPGCATTVPVHEMSAAKHEQAAVHEEQAAAGHEKQYDLTQIQAMCSNLSERQTGVVCWASSKNPTERHLKEVQQHRALAAAHRAASQVLRAAEASACVGIPEPDRDLSPFAHREEIVRVDSLSTPGSGGTAPRLYGMTVVFRAVPGLTTEWLQHLVDCHIARNAALGHDMPEMAFCPLALRDITAQVGAADGGIGVTIRSADTAIVMQIRERANGLLAPSR